MPTLHGYRAIMIPNKNGKYTITTYALSLSALCVTDVVYHHEVKLDEGATCDVAYVKIPMPGRSRIITARSSTSRDVFCPDKCGFNSFYSRANSWTGENKEKHHEEKRRTPLPTMAKNVSLTNVTKRTTVCATTCLNLHLTGHPTRRFAPTNRQTLCTKCWRVLPILRDIGRLKLEAFDHHLPTLPWTICNWRD